MRLRKIINKINPCISLLLIAAMISVSMPALYSKISSAQSLDGCMLSITKSADVTTIAPGEDVVFTINFTNIGDEDCTGSGVLVQDIVDDNVEYISESHSSEVLSFRYDVDPLYFPDYDLASRTLSWNADVITPGESGWVSWVGKAANLERCGTYSIFNTAKITSHEYSPSFDEGIFVWEYSNTVEVSLIELCPNPAIQIIKEANPTSLPNAGGNVDYSYTVTNPGNVPLTNISVTDDKCSPVNYNNGDNGDNVLSISETWNYTCSKYLINTTTNIATATGIYDSASVQDTDEATVTITEYETCPLYEKDGRILIHLYDTIAHPGKMLRSDHAFDDSYYGPLTTSIPGGNYDVTFVSFDNHASKQGQYQPEESWLMELYDNSSFLIVTTNTIGDLPDDENWKTEIVNHGLNISSDISYFSVFHTAYPDSNPNSIRPICAAFDIVSEPAINIIKKANPTSLPNGGGNVDYSYAVTNPGNVTLTDIVLSDDKCSSVAYVDGDTNTNDKLETTETWNYACSKNITQTTTNIVTVTGKYNATAISDTDEATVTINPPQTCVSGCGGGGGSLFPAIRLIKTPAPYQLPKDGGSVTYTYLVSNPGYYAITDIVLTDDKCNNIKFIDGDKNTDNKLDRNEIWKYTCQSNITETTINTAIVNGKSIAGNVKDTTKATVYVPKIDLAIKLEKTANPESLSEKGGLVTYSYKVLNKGAKAISDIALTDDKCDPINLISGDLNKDKKLDTAETWLYACQSNITETTINTGTVRGQVDGKYATDSSTAIVRVGKVLGTNIIPKGMPKTGFGIIENKFLSTWQQAFFAIFILLAITNVKSRFKKSYK
jgi:uncharacterized repeat protein (TIGR01451 family)